MTGETEYIDMLFGNYRVVAELYEGLLGGVYLARHVHLPRRAVAIKLFQSERVNDAQKQAMFFQEAQLLDMLKHPHILPLIDAGIEHNLPYVVVEYAPNGSLRDRLDRQLHTPLPLEEALIILSQIGQAIQYAHEQQIIHCDLKPENVLFNRRDEALLADFGVAVMLAKVDTRYIAGFGSFAYMAPEQFAGNVSEKSDQYSLGCIAYELFTGHPPFSAFSFRGMREKHLTEAPVAPTQLNPKLPEHIEQAILKAMAKDSSDRHADVNAFLTASGIPGLVQSSVTTLASPPSLSSSSLPEMQEPATKEQWLEEALTEYNHKNFTEALAAYEHAIELDPDDAYVYVGKGLVLCDLEQYDTALTVFEQAIELDPDDTYAYIGKGQMLRMAGRFQESLDIYQQVIMVDPNDAEAYMGKGLALAQLHQPWDALLAYEEAIICDGHCIAAWINKAHALEQLERVEEAQQAQAKAQQLMAIAEAKAGR
jgi:tetratricopeptide (TPR) repeat protein